MLKLSRARSRLLKKLPHAPDEVAHETGLGVESIEIWRSRSRRASARKQDYARRAGLSVRSTPPQRSPRSAHRLNLYFRCRLPEGVARGAGLILLRLQYRGDEPAPCGDRCSHRAQCPCRPDRRPSGKQHVQAPCRSTQHHTHSAAAKSALSSTPVENIWQFKA